MKQDTLNWIKNWLVGYSKRSKGRELSGNEKSRLLLEVIKIFNQIIKDES